MYWFSLNQPSEDRGPVGQDCMYFALTYSQDKGCYSDISKLLMKSLQLGGGNEFLDQEFLNILHALQLIRFTPPLVETIKVCRIWK
ncbi:hypothetical protein TorRG33x02_296570 [Trema orientale]|uniref:Uncharacterized protein n=1 Tax=Trema orientale TaxID=63057 RepID=A0A2P5C5P2_TREOI|nr:hypothetical protein TorRG33x02_296570 [Trema orientale]